MLVMSPIVESPTGIAHVISQNTSGPVRASQMLPNIPSSALLSVAECNQRGLQWAYDTFEGAIKVAKQSTETALELIKDTWDQSSSSTIPYLVIALWVVSNIYTLTVMGRRYEAGRAKEMRRTEEREKWVQGVVTTLWDELTAQKQGAGAWQSAGRPLTSGSGDIKTEIAELSNVLDQIEERVRTIRASMAELD